MTGFVLCCLSLLFFTSLLAFSSSFRFFIQSVAELRLALKNSFFCCHAFGIDLFRSFSCKSTILHSQFFESTLRNNPVSQHLLLLIVGFAETTILCGNLSHGLGQKCFKLISTVTLKFRTSFSTRYIVFSIPQGIAHIIKCAALTINGAALLTHLIQNSQGSDSFQKVAHFSYSFRSTNR